MRQLPAACHPLPTPPPWLSCAIPSYLTTYPFYHTGAVRIPPPPPAGLFLHTTYAGSALNYPVLCCTVGQTVCRKPPFAFFITFHLSGVAFRLPVNTHAHTRALPAPPQPAATTYAFSLLPFSHAAPSCLCWLPFRVPAHSCIFRCLVLPAFDTAPLLHTRHACSCLYAPATHAAVTTQHHLYFCYYLPAPPSGAPIGGWWTTRMIPA